MKTLLYIDVATFVNDANPQMVKNHIRQEQIKEGLRKLFEYDFSNCDILITDNTCTELPKDIDALLPPKTIRRLFEDNRFGSKNKGAGLIQKWEYNEPLLHQYDYVLHFEARLQLTSYSFFDDFFSCPRTLFRWGDLAQTAHTNVFTGLFAAEVKDILSFCKRFSKEYLIQNHISIEYPMREHLKDSLELVAKLGVTWYAFDGGVHEF